MQKKRLETLVKEGKKFTEAKEKSKKEVLKVFNIDETKVSKPLTELDIKTDGELLWASVIAQGDEGSEKVAELVKEIEGELESKGKVSSKLIDKLTKKEEKINFEKIKQNLEKKLKTKLKVDIQKISKKKIKQNPQDNRKKYKIISAGNEYSLAIGEDDYLYSWGDNSQGQLGIGDSNVTFSLSPVKVGNRKYKVISAGKHHSLAIDEDDYLYSWGDNSQGQLGIGDNNVTFSLSPVKVGNRKYKVISAGKYHSLAIDEDDYLYSWGDNSQGQLGTGNADKNNKIIPTKIDGVKKYKEIVASDIYSLALDESGILYSWGGDSNGRLGKGESWTLFLKTACQCRRNLSKVGDRKYTIIRGRKDHSMALTEDGSLYSWGDNSSAEFADAGTARLYPTKIGTKKYSNIFPGNHYRLVIDKDNSLYSWGDNFYGVLGTGKKIYEVSPVNIGGSIKYKTASAGYSHALAIDENGYLYVWGRNNKGQLGDGTKIDKNQPTQLKL